MFWTTIQNIWRLQIILTTVSCGSEKVKGVTMAFLEQGPNQGSQVERGKRVVLSGGQNLWHLCPAAMFLSPKARFGVWQTASNYMGHRSKLGPFKLKDFSPNFRTSSSLCSIVAIGASTEKYFSNFTLTLSYSLFSKAQSRVRDNDIGALPNS